MSLMRQLLLSLGLLGLLCTAPGAWAQDPTTPPLPPLPGTGPKPVPAPAPIPSAPSLDVKSYLLLDYETGQVLAERNAGEQVEPASITKVMAAYVLFGEIRRGQLKLEDQVRVSERAWKQGLGGSRMFIPVNAEVAVKDLLLGMIVQSGNDATVALAEHVAGSEEAFVVLMNQQAQTLGMSGSHFTNAPGLPDPEHYTTAADLAKLAQAMIRDYPEYYAWYSVREFSFNGIKQYNRNTLLARDPTVDGMKTGHTESAGFCLLSSAKRDAMRLIAVVMGSKSEKARADESQALLNYGFRFFESHQLYAAQQPLSEQELWKGAVDQIHLGLDQPIRVVIPRGHYDRLKASMELPQVLIAPIEKGQTIGKVRIKLDDKLLLERPLIALDAGLEGGIFRRLGDGIALWWNGG